MIPLMVLAAVLPTGCTFDEHLPQVDIHGVVRLPYEAATGKVIDPATGLETEVNDPRFLGPVWIGAFPDISYDDFSYPHPEMGPVIGEEVGDTYPYGGGSVGRFDYACFQSLTCQITTGRFEDFESILDFFNNVINDPVIDDLGRSVDSADYFRASCYQLLEVTADWELSFIASENGGLDFSLSDDGAWWEAEFDLWQVTYHKGMKLWGWMDAPSEKFTFSTCDESRGQSNSEYANDYEYGASATDLLNKPSYYIYSGDWVTGNPVQLDAEDADAFREAPPDIQLDMDFKVED